MKRSLTIIFMKLLISASIVLVTNFLFSTSTLYAQLNPIPDSSFELWESGTPPGWSVDTLQVFQSSDAHTGLWAAKGSVLSDSSATPFLETTIPVQYRPEALDGYYKLTSVDNDEILFFVTINSGQSPIAVASFVDSSSRTEYRHFSIPLSYSVDNPPDSVMILIVMENSQMKLHAGSSFVVDDISLTGNAANPFVSVKATPQIPQFGLVQSYPNPFSQSTTITFSSQEEGYAEVTIVNLLGAQVARLFSGELTSGEHSFVWDASEIRPGMYECVAQMNGQIKQMPMILAK
jgi:Secretion system C-terminal sorting domain